MLAQPCSDTDGSAHLQLEEAGTHSSLFPKKFEVYPDVLEKAGYHVGYTGKGWGPGNWRDSGRPRNPAGPEYNKRTFPSVPWSGIDRTDYAANFEDFLAARPADTPFCFWYGGHEPHRKYQQGAGHESGKKTDDVVVPAFLPDAEEVRSDLLDYFVETEWFDTQLGKMLQKLEALGELDNTIVVVTGDNGMPFPRAKANLYEYGVRVPVAIRWGASVRGGRRCDDLISFVDFAPTFLDAAGIEPHTAVSGEACSRYFCSSGANGPNELVLFGRERHSHARYDNLGYPARAIRTPDHLYIWNLKPDLWPAGDPDKYYDIDDGPTKTFLLQNKEKYPGLVEMAVGKRPKEELYDIGKSMDCVESVADDPQYRSTRDALAARLKETLLRQNDPRMGDNGDIFDSYPRFGGMRPKLGGFAKQGAHNPKYAPKK